MPADEKHQLVNSINVADENSFSEVQDHPPWYKSCKTIGLLFFSALVVVGIVVMLIVPFVQTHSFVKCVRNSVKARLPTSVIPLHYSLYFDMNLENRTFNAVASIDIEVTETTGCILLNSQNLIYSDIVLYDSKNHTHPYHSYLGYKEVGGTDKLAITYSESIEAGFQGRLVFNYSGSLSYYKTQDSHGFYYVDTPNPAVDGPWIYVTQFEPNFASQAFPCWDEPGFKSTFDYTFVVPDNPKIVVLTNTREISVVFVQNGKKEIKFDRTPHKMSTYLVAFAIGTFVQIQEIKNGLTYRAYTPPSLAGSSSFVLDTTVRSVQFFQNLFNQSYSFPKLDSLLVPRRGGAMENWGLIMYDTNRWPNPQDPNQSFDDVQASTNTISHEVSHQWWGNSITCAWWNETYINEGFARYYGYVAINALFPEWNNWEQFVRTKTLPALNIDQSGLYPAVIKPSNIGGNNSLGTTLGSAFDIITYNKGGSINRMFAEFLGSTWDTAMISFLNKYRFANPTLDDLIHSLQEAGFDDAHHLRTWLTTPGFPIVYLELDSPRNIIRLSQKPSSLAQRSQLWYIPLTIIAFDSALNPIGNPIKTNFSLAGPIVVPIPPNTNFVIGNPDTVGYFGVRYTPANWEKILTVTANSSTLVKLSTISNLFVVIGGCHELLILGFNLTRTLVNERDPIVWRSILSQWDLVLHHFYLESYYGKMELFLAKNLENLVAYVGWNSTVNPNVDKSFRELVLFTSVYFEDPVSLAQALTIYQDFTTKNKSIPIEVTKAVFWVAVRSRTDPILEYNRISEIYTKALIENDEWLAASALTGLMGSIEPYLCEKTLYQIIDTNNSTTLLEKIEFAFQMIKLNPAGKVFATYYITSKFADIERWYGEGTYLERIPNMLVESTSTVVERETIYRFFNEHYQIFSEAFIRRCIQQVDFNIQFVGCNSQSLERFFTNLN